MDNELLKALSTLFDEKLEPIKNDIKSLKSDVAGLKDDVTGLKKQQEESYQILKSLEHKAEINKAEHDKFSNEIAHLAGEIQNMRKDLSTVEIVTARNMENIAQLKIIK